MTIAVRPYLPDDLSAICDIYNALLVGRVPHCWPVAPSSLDETLQAGEIEREETRLLEQAVLVAGSGGDGFVHVGRQATNKWRKDEIGAIRFLAYRRGERAVGDALLAAAESWMRERNLRRSVVMPQPWRYPFYAFPHAYLSDHLDHVQALVRFRGYAKTGGEVFLDWLDMQPELASDASGLDYELCVEDRPGAGSRPGLRVRAVQDGDGIGECELVSGADSSSADEAHDFAFCDWLGVEEEHQVVVSDASCWYTPCTWRASAAIATVPSAPLLTTTAPSYSIPTTVSGSSIGPTNSRGSFRDLRPRLPRCCP